MEAVKRYGILTVGSVVLGISDYMFKFQNHFSFGGVSGIAVIMRGLLGGSASTYTFVINMLLLVVAFILLGKEVAMQSAYVSVLYSVTLEVIQYVWPMSKPLTNQPVLELVFCFMILAVCSAIFFDMNASSGGIDIVAKLINKYLGFKIGQSITIIGVLISMAAIFVYDRETMVISLVGTLIYGQVLDRFCDGFHVRKKVSILSKEHEKIQNYIVRELRRGATIYPAYGGLDHAEHVEVVTILEKNEYGKLLSFIHETDEHAFVTVSTVNEVVGAWNTVKSR